jgi:hypothetical protein
MYETMMLEKETPENEKYNPKNTSHHHRAGCVSLARTAGSVRVNEKTAENPRSWPQQEAISPLKGDGSQDFRCFFRAGRRIVRAGPFGTFGLTKVHADNLFFRFMGSNHGMISSLLSIKGKYMSIKIGAKGGCFGQQEVNHIRPCPEVLQSFGNF